MPAPRQFIVDAFELGPFSGNPAAVVVLPEARPEDWMQQVAAQNNLSETAFLRVDAAEELRWFTPTTEVDLCGHATLASVHVLSAELDDPREEFVFSTRSGELRARRVGELYELDFPAETHRQLTPDQSLHDALKELCGEGGELWEAGPWLMLVLESETAVRDFTVDGERLRALGRGELIVTAAGLGEGEIVARVFAPGLGIAEDPATGSAHCALAPWWCERLDLTELTSRQLSVRGGLLHCRWSPGSERVLLRGSCRTFLRGELEA